jgi:hypothetical protein
MLLVLVTSIRFAGTADEPKRKNCYTPFNPTPESLLRELATDRSDKTERPITVDAGHFQFEMDFAT